MRNRWNRKNAFWIALAAPGIVWLLVLFIVPVYAVLAIALGKLDQLLESPVAVWNPLDWSSSAVIDVWRDIVGSSSFAGPIIIRTLVYTAIASLLCLLIGYPAAYFVARFAGRRKALFLVLLIAPFWISYMMRMLAWIDLLSTGGYVNSALGWAGISPVNWLGGESVTVVLGLVYGYIPYLIIVLYAGAPADPDRPADHGAADAGGLLHQPDAVGRGIHLDDRQPDPGSARHPRPGGPGRRALPHAAARPAHPDGLLRHRDQPRGDTVITRPDGRNRHRIGRTAANDPSGGAP